MTSWSVNPHLAGGLDALDESAADDHPGDQQRDEQAPLDAAQGLDAVAQVQHLALQELFGRWWAMRREAKSSERRAQK